VSSGEIVESVVVGVGMAVVYLPLAIGLARLWEQKGRGEGDEDSVVQ
jgi:hypothetical protein